jgi:hypothetical protein
MRGETEFWAAVRRFFHLRLGGTAYTVITGIVMVFVHKQSVFLRTWKALPMLIATTGLLRVATLS